MRWLKRLLLGLLALGVLAVVAAAVFVYTFDANRHREFILQQMGQSVGRPVEAANLELRLWPLRLRLNQVRVADAPEFAAEEFIRADALQLDMSLTALLRGQPQVDTMELDRPTVFLRQNPAGVWNVAALGPAASGDAEGGAKETAATQPAEAPVRNWRLRDGTIVIEPAGREPVRLTGVVLELNDLSATEAFPFRLVVHFSPASRLDADGNLGPLNLTAPERTPFDAKIAMENFRPAALAPLVAVPPEVARLGALGGVLTVRATPEGFVFGGRVSLLGAQPGDNVDVELMRIALPADWSRVELTDTGVVYQGSRVRANGTVTLLPLLGFDLAAESNGADLGALARLPARLGVALPFSPPAASGTLTMNLKINGALSEWQMAGQATLSGLEVPLEGWAQPLRVQNLELAIAPARIAAAPFAFSPAPGVNLTLSAAVSDYRSVPRLEARASGAETPLAPLLALAAQFGVKVLSEGQQVTGFVAPNLDVSGPLAEPARWSYAGQLKFRDLTVTLPELARPLQVAAAVIELDRQKLTAGPFAVTLEPGVTLTLAGTVEDYAGAARIRARVTGDEVSVAPLLALAQGLLGADLLGAGRSLTGRVRPAFDVSGPLAEPAKLSYQGTLGVRDAMLTTPPLPEPVRIAAMELAVTPARLSAEPFLIQIGEKLRARVNFRLDDYRAKPALQARVATDGAELESLLALARALGADPLPGSKVSGRITGTIDLAGSLADKAPPPDISGQVQLAGVSLQLAELTKPLEVEQAAADFSPRHLAVTNLRVAAAGSRVQGTMRVDNFDAPGVQFNLRGDLLDVEALQALFGAPPPAARPPARRSRLGLFSLPVVYAQERRSDPAAGGTGWFAKLTGRGRLEFDRVRNGTMTLAPFASPVVIADQVVTCDPVEFGFYDGGGRGRLVMDLRGAEPAAEFRGLLRNVDVNKLLSENSESKNQMTGRMGGTVEVRFTGSERKRITQSAKGKGQVTLVNGRLARMNLSREMASLVKALGLSYNQSDTPIEDMTTNFDIADGWVRTEDLTLRTPDLTATAVGGFSLEDELAFAGTGTFTPEASQRMTSASPLGALTSSLFTDDEGRVVVPFNVRGTLAEPKFTLDAGRLAEMRLKRRSVKPGGTLGDILDRLRRKCN